MLFDREGQQVRFQRGLGGLRLGKQAFHAFRIDMAIIKLLAQLGVDDKFHGRRERIERRNVQVVEKARQRRITVGEQAVGVMDFIARRGEDLVEHLLLLVAEQILEGIIAVLAKMRSMSRINSGKISALKGGPHLLPPLLLVGLRFAVIAYAAGQVMIAHVEHTVGQGIRPQRDGKGDVDATRWPAGRCRR